MPTEHGAQPTSSDFVGARRHGTCDFSNKVMFIRNSEHCAQPFIKEVEGARTQRGMSDPNTETLVKDMGRCATPNKSEIEMARTKKDSSELKTVVIRAEVHAENTEAEHLVHFEESDDFSDAGSLITQAPQSQSIHATINALSSWVSAIQPRESWYLAGWILDECMVCARDLRGLKFLARTHTAPHRRGPHPHRTALHCPAGARTRPATLFCTYCPSSPHRPALE